MDLKELILLIVFAISGAVTCFVLDRHKMHTAKISYAIAFIILFTYFPISAGNNMLYYLIGQKLPLSEPFLYEDLIEPLIHITPYFNASLIAIIAISLFFSASVVVFAFFAARTIYRIVLKRRGTNYQKRRDYKKIKVYVKEMTAPVCPYRYVFCRYNC